MISYCIYAAVMRKYERDMKMKMKRTVKFRSAGVLALICAAAVVLCACAGGGGQQGSSSASESHDTVRAAGTADTIIVGSDYYPPYNYTDTDGTPTGIDVDIAREAFKRMGFKVRFITIDWEQKKELLADGDIDCIWGCFSMDGRENEYKWAGPYMLSRQMVAVRSDSDIYTLEDLSGKTVAVQTTTKPEEILLSHSDSRIPQVGELFSVQNRRLIYPMLSKGYVDAVAAHETSIIQYMKDFDVEYRILDESLLDVGIGVAFDLNDERGIAEELSETFKQMREDGTAEKIVGKYLDDAAKYLEVDDDK